MLMRAFVVSMVFFHLCGASQQSHNRTLKKSRMKIQSDLSIKELNLLNEEQRTRLNSSYVDLDDCMFVVDTIEITDKSASPQIYHHAAVENPLLTQKS